MEKQKETETTSSSVENNTNHQESLKENNLQEEQNNKNINLIEDSNESENENLIEDSSEDENINENESIYKEIKPKPAKVQIFSNFEISQLNQDLFITAISFDQWKYLESEFSHLSTFYKKEEPKKPEIQKSTFPEEFCLSIFTFINENNREYQNKEIVENNYKKGKVNFNCVHATKKKKIQIRLNHEKMGIFDLDEDIEFFDLRLHEYQFFVSKNHPHQLLISFFSNSQMRQSLKRKRKK
ncbi:hypothetical protein M0811_02927 [Anaeramoeba ignava]|uniref:Uncharacterized protein n=1 Tax=Anaeramoeba ignava TaxID=1746090 RepID=A0A9Q0R549_ANAIG|nr:hypothetical protein M0811_02927 [Anaeramoeba ignava]